MVISKDGRWELCGDTSLELLVSRIMCERECVKERQWTIVCVWISVTTRLRGSQGPPRLTMKQEERGGVIVHQRQAEASLSLPLMALRYSAKTFSSCSHSVITHTHHTHAYTQTTAFLAMWLSRKWMSVSRLARRLHGCELCPMGTTTWKVINGSVNCSTLHRFITESGMLRLSLVTWRDSNPFLTSSYRDEFKTGIWTFCGKVWYKLRNRRVDEERREVTE